MKKQLKLAALFSVIYMITEISFVLLDVNHNFTVHLTAIGINMMCLLLAVAIGIITNFNANKHKGVSIIVDLKIGITTSVFYALITAMFLFSYYHWIDPEYPEMIKEQRMQMAESEEFKEQIALQIKKDPDFYVDKSVDDIIDNEAEGIETVLDANKVFLISFISLLILGMFYAFAVTGINRLILSKL